MIFVDTSVWIAAFRGRDQPLVEHLAHLLDEQAVALSAPVHLELLGGGTAQQQRQLRRTLSALPIFYPTRDTWALLERWVVRAVEAGERFGIGDLLIAATASERGGEVWSLDSDFRRMQKLRLLRCHQPGK